MSGSSPSNATLFLGAFVFAGLLLAPGPAQTPLEKLQTKFERETNPVHKAKKLTELGRAEFDALREALNSGNVEGAAKLAERYRDQAAAAHSGLVAAGLDAGKHADGFKQLQVSLRENIFKLRDLTPTLPLDQRAPFLAVQHDLETLNQRLLDELFPAPANPGGKKGR